MPHPRATSIIIGARRKVGNSIRAWPSAVIVDKKGVVRHTHVGEGAYRETEEVIRKLLDER